MTDTITITVPLTSAALEAASRKLLYMGCALEQLEQLADVDPADLEGFPDDPVREVAIPKGAATGATVRVVDDPALAPAAPLVPEPPKPPALTVVPDPPTAERTPPPNPGSVPSAPAQALAATPVPFAPQPAQPTIVPDAPVAPPPRGLDSKGTMFDPSVHTGKKNLDDTWRRRRGSGPAAAPAADTGPTKEDINTAVGVLAFAEVPYVEIDEPVSQTMAVDLAVTSGGLAKIFAGQSTPAERVKAMSSIQAVALSKGIPIDGV